MYKLLKMATKMTWKQKVAQKNGETIMKKRFPFKNIESRFKSCCILFIKSYVYNSLF